MDTLIVVPLKRPIEDDLIKPALTTLFHSTFTSDYHEINYANLIEDFASLRTEAIWGAFDKHENSLEKLYRYYDQLCSLEERIPTNKVEIPFKWKDAFDRKIISNKNVGSITTEKLCILFNIGALQSAVASNQSLKSDKGLQLAAKLLQQSAGIFNYLKQFIVSLHQDITLDLSLEVLTGLSALMLSQAQEIFIEKAIQDSMKSQVIAKLSAHAGELYKETLIIFKTNIFTSLTRTKQWVSIINSKRLGYQALAQMYQSTVCKNNKQFGEEISRLQCAVKLFKDAQYQFTSDILTSWSDKAQERLKEVQKDNHYIYNEIIPDIKNLKRISQAKILKLQFPNCPMSLNFDDIFKDILPIKVQQSLLTFENLRKNLIDTEILKLKEETKILDTILANLNLPLAIEEKKNSQPVYQSLCEKSIFIKQSGGIEALENILKRLPDVSKKNQDIINTSIEMLIKEQDADNELRIKYRDKWTRTTSDKLTVKLRKNLQAYQDTIHHAHEADKILEKLYEENKEYINILSMDEEKLLRKLSSGVGVKVSWTVIQLRKLIDDVDDLRVERDLIENNLKSALVDMKSTFLIELAKNDVIDEFNLSVENIKKTYGSLIGQVRDNLAKQKTYVKKIQSVYDSFKKEKSEKGDVEETIKKLDKAYDAYMILNNHLNEGLDFYNELIEILIKLKNKILKYCISRNSEKEKLINSLIDNENIVCKVTRTGFSLSFPSATETTDSHELPHMPKHYKYCTFPRSGKY
ncbi:programmed cell death 6-interacting protein-like [Aphidius gifuensis]|uniref:programmed cell death 6-interacting protein-like n=1 Tax=Aphidius gifuensis TaxID=684658 RepID=UPI001CDC0ED1|nr:programmed cell death 6-interacting protein-like [Aphidius gifuensis]